MKLILKFNRDKIIFNSIIVLVWIKLIFSYLSVKLEWFQRFLISNYDRFNFFGLPEEFSNNVEFVLLPLMGVFIIQNYRTLGKTIDLFWISIIMIGLNLVTSLLNNIPVLDSINYSLKIFAPIYLFLSIIIYKKKYDINTNLIARRTIILCLSLTLIGVLFFNPSFNRLRNFLPIFFTGTHTHSYVLVSVFIGIGYFFYRENRKYLLIFFLFISVSFLYIGYGVRTALLMYLTFAITILYLISNVFKFIFIKIIIFSPFIIMFVLIFVVSVIDFNQLSSGRTSMYVAKFDQLLSFGLFDWFFGRGFGSDLIESKVWWWEKKGSHSDVLSFIVENGIIYLGLYFIIFIRLIFLPNKINLIYTSFLVGIFITGLISNGVMVRPLASYVTFIILAHIYIDIKERNLSLN